MIDAGPLKANDLTVQQLRTFCVVFERGSYSAASKALDLSVQTIWEQVQALTRHYATALFQKQGRRIVPTRRAELLYESLRPLLAGLDSTFEMVREEESRPHTLTIVLGVRMMLEEMGPPLKRFRDRHPYIRLRLLHGDNRTAEKLVAEGGADLALTLAPGPGVISDAVRYERVYENEHFALLPAGHPLARKGAVRLRDLVDYPLIIGHEGTYGRRLLEQALYQEGLLDRAQVAIETGNSAFTVACVRAGMGIGILSGRPGNALTSDLVARSLRRYLGRADIILMWKNGRQLTRPVHSFIEDIRTL